MYRFIPFAVLFLWCVIISIGHTQRQGWGDLKLRFVYDGDPPKPQKIADQVGEAFCGDLSLVDESLLVNPVNRGIRNIVVYAYEGVGGRKLPAVHSKEGQERVSFELANVRCNYQPRVVVMKSGDSLSVVNTDIIGYNAMFGFIANASRNFALPGKSAKQFTIDKSEPAPVPVECTIYPWMKARVLVLEHRYSAISDKNGELVIENLPVNVPLAFRIYHESAKFPGVTIGEALVSRRGVFDVTLDKSETDLGTVKLNPAIFR